MDRETAINRLVEDVSENMYDSHEFIMVCVRAYIEKWDNKRLSAWLGDADITED